MAARHALAPVLIAASLAAGAVARTAEPPASRSLGPSYLGGRPMADSLLLSPPPPSSGSPAEARDVAASKTALGLSGTPRGLLATRDADLSGDPAAAAFSCAAGVAIGAATTPRLDRLLRMALPDLGLSTSAIKARYQRARPFTVNGSPTCTPQMEERLRRDGSYPSGHSAIGYGTALILAELVPDRAAAIMARGRAFGESRMICNAHWLSDVEEGRLVAAATVARLHADPAFRHDLKAARAELRHPHAAPSGCQDEAAALAFTAVTGASPAVRDPGVSPR